MLFQLFVRAFARDGSSKSIMVDEKMCILEVIAVLADKNHVKLTPDLAVVEHMPELYMGTYNTRFYHLTMFSMLSNDLEYLYTKLVKSNLQATYRLLGCAEILK